MKFIEKIKTQIAIVFFLQLIVLIMLFLLDMIDIAIAMLLILAIDSILILWIINTIQNEKRNEDIDINRTLGSEANNVFDYGEIGIITFNDQFDITWISDFLLNRGIDFVGKKITKLFPEMLELINENLEEIIGEYDGRIYEVQRKKDGHVLYLKDVTKFENIKNKYLNQQTVLGYIHLDNYRDYSAFEDENRMAQINVNLRQPIIEWANKYGMVIRRLKSDQFLVVLNEEIYSKIKNNHFEVLKQTRQKANEIDANITISMAFARGETSLSELDEMASDLLEMAQSRGGDQVASKVYGEDVVYYGGKSEATNTRSRVRVRVNAQAIKEIISEHDKVFIIGHKVMDFDCMGACLAFSQMVHAYHKEAYIVSKSGGLESHLKEALDNYDDILNERHNFISEDEGLKMCGNNDLVIVVDHHSPSQSGAVELLEKVNNAIVIDHHRRTNTFINNPLLVYLESSASSTCELVTELIAYQPIRIGIKEEEATIMYTGIIVDTNRFKTHTGARTFEACSTLRKWGVDSKASDLMLSEDYEHFKDRNLIYSNGFIYKDNIFISCIKDKIMERSMLSIGADSLLDLKGIEASFVLGYSEEKCVSISARSNGKINVQVIMEKLNGGGHFAAAASLLENTTVEECLLMLEKIIDDYLEEEDK